MSEVCRDWPTGTRVRCVNAGGNIYISNGCEYTVHRASGDGTIVQLFAYGTWYKTERFKPVVRVKMGRAVA